MNSLLLGKLQSIYPSLSSAERRIAQQVLENPDDVLEYSGRQLVNLSQTSETALFRLMAKLGVGGFKEFKLELLRDQTQDRTRAELGIFNVSFQPGSPAPVQIQEVLQAYGANLEKTAALLAAEPVDDVVEAIRDSSLVTLLGMGASLSVATLAENILLRLGVRCQLSQDSHMQLLQAMRTEDRHVVVGFSYSGETRETVESLEVARGSGARTIAVTAFRASSIAQKADLLLAVPVVNPQLYRVGLVDAVLPYLMVLDLIAIRMAAGEHDAAALRQRVESTIERRKLRPARRDDQSREIDLDRR